MKETCLLSAGMSWFVYVCCHCQHTYFVLSSKNGKGGKSNEENRDLDLFESSKRLYWGRLFDGVS